MAGLGLYYLCRSVQDCVQAAQDHSALLKRLIAVQPSAKGGLDHMSQHVGTAGPSSAPQEPQGAIRGVCPACRRNVYKSDKGTVRQGEQYYHADYVKKVCRQCSEEAYGDQERGR